MKNMYFCFVLLVLLALNTTSKEHERNLQDRVRFVKENIQRELRAKQQAASSEPIDELQDKVSYESNDDPPIRSEMDSGQLNKHDKIKKRLKTTTETPAKLLSPLPTDHLNEEHKREHKALRGAAVSRPLDIYRRVFGGANTVIPWLHCSEMISPFVKGAKKEMTRPRQIGVKDHIVLRSIQLLRMNTTSLDRDEVYSILYQISKLKIRLWSWSIPSIRMLFNVITHSEEKHHSFKTLKHGLKLLFNTWQLDRSNTTRLLMQARVFRPPCLNHKHTGSSKFVRGSTISIPSTTAAESSEEFSQAHDHGQ